MSSLFFEVERPSYEFEAEQKTSLQQHAQQQVQQQLAHQQQVQQQQKSRKTIELLLNQIEEDLAQLKVNGGRTQQHGERQGQQQQQTIDIEQTKTQCTCPVCGVTVAKEMAQYEIHVNGHFTD